MTAAQEKFYWRLWSGLKKARGLASEDRHAEHAAAGLPESHTAWGNRDFDKWKGHCLAASRPADLGVQLDAQNQPQRRRRWRIARLCAQLGRGLDYGAATAARMNREGALGNGDLESLDEVGLEAVIVALKKQLARERRAGKAVAHAKLAGAEIDIPF